MKLWIWLCLGLWPSSQLFSQALTGRVVDADTKEPLPGVAILYNQSLLKGTFTDNNGYFVIPKITDIERVSVTLIGYEGVTFQVYEIARNGKLWQIELKSGMFYLEEVKVVAGENPALRMVRNAIANRKANNPRFYESYEYTSYNKNIIVSKKEAKDDLSARDLKRFMRDTARSSKQHILVLESVTKKWYKSPNMNREEVIATKISGFQEPGVATTPDAIQNFAFHENIIPLVNKKYLNPIADGADKNYVYILSDTLVSGQDTVYTMDYFPKKGSNFEGFQGKLSISTKKWALVGITAAPFDMGKVNIYLEQDYRWIEGYWFPHHMNFELELERVPLTPNGAIMVGKTTLDSIKINVPLRNEMFNHIEVVLNKGAPKVSENFWDDYRPTQLTPQELKTYQHMDSVGQRFKFDALLKSTRNVYQGFIALNYVDVEMNKLLAFNQYEGTRVGLGLYTNEDIWEKVRVGGYVGYGFRDQNWKYGFSGRYYFNRLNDFFITASYLDDVRDPGGIRLKYYEWGTVAQQFFNVLMDRVQEAEVSLTFRPQKYTLLKIGARHFGIAPTYNYIFLGNSDQPITNFAMTEAQFVYRWQHREKFSTNFGQRISQGSRFPVVSFAYSRGFGAEFNSDFTYNKLEAGISFIRYIKKFGRLRISLESGYIDRPLPWSMNFSGRPSFNPSFSVVVKETFQTMRFNEFSSDRYAAFFFMHDFGPLLLRTKKFKPEVRLAHAMTWGSLRNPELHIGVPFKTLEKGFFESGVIIDNIIRINTMNAGYFGIGGGVFYRYGAYHLTDLRDNFTFKVAFMYSVN